MIRRPPRSTLFPYTSSSDLAKARRRVLVHRAHAIAAMIAVARPSSRSEKAQRRQPTAAADRAPAKRRSEEHTSELQSLAYLVCRLLLEKKKRKTNREHQVLS